MPTILIVDDDPSICILLSETVIQEGWTAVGAHNLNDALKKAESNDIDVVLLDIHLPDGSGLKTLPSFVGSERQPEVIIITAYGCEDAPGLALEYGAWDYLEKPFNLKKIVLSIRRALEFRRAKMNSRRPRILKRAGIIGSSPAINNCLEQMSEAAEGEHSVLLLGETGTGKELFARAIHLNSQRADQNFVVVDCATLNSTLMGSTLFGHVKGAFTDASRNRDGLIKLAHRGTLFLDEIGEMPPEMQKQLLRVLEEKKFRPVGGTTEIDSDFRLISATNQDLADMTQNGTFRKDLLYRINAQKLVLPPLRDRKEDIPELVNHYQSKICRRMGMSPKIIQPEFMQCLLEYDWPGNVRELINVLEQAISTGKALPALFHKHLPAELRSCVILRQSHTADKSALPPPAATAGPALPDGEDIINWNSYRKIILNDAEKKYFEQLLSITRGDIDRVAEMAQISKSRVYGLLGKHNLSLGRHKQEEQ